MDTPIVIATDCQRLVSQLNQNDRNWTVLDGVLDGLRRHLNQDRKWKMIFCSRNINGVAHRLAKIGLSLDTNVTWLYSSHPHVMKLLHSDWLHLS